jgi:hypothetical protein
MVKPLLEVPADGSAPAINAALARCVRQAIISIGSAYGQMSVAGRLSRLLIGQGR